MPPLRIHGKVNDTGQIECLSSRTRPYKPDVQFRQLVVLGIFLIFPATLGRAQTEWQDPDESLMQEVMPTAGYFSEKQGSPPVYKGYSGNEANESELVGYVFTTPDLPPEEIGYSGPIDSLIGLNLAGEITGVKILYYEESYKYGRGDFIEESGYPAQFIGKSVDDGFRVNGDVDGMSRATISSWAVARGIRNAARRVAIAYLPGSSFAVEANAELEILGTLSSQNWDDYRMNGFVREFSVPVDGASALNFAIAYMGHYRLGELLIGASAYSNSDRAASDLVEDGHMLLLALSGSTARLQQRRLGAIQGNTLYPNTGDRIVFAGTGSEGKIAGQASMALAFYIDPAIDLREPFSVVYDTGETAGAFDDYSGVEYEVPAEVLALLTGALPENPGRAGNPALTGLAGLFVLVLLILNLPRIRAAWKKGKSLS